MRHRRRPGPSPTVSFQRVRRGGADAFAAVRCADCGAALEPVFPADTHPDGTWRHLQADRALHIRLAGGFGEFVDLRDDLGEPADDCHLLLCVACARRLVDAHPWLAEVVADHLDITVGRRCGDGIAWSAPDGTTRGAT